MARVLLVEDDPDIRSTVIRQLSEFVHSVRSAGTALAALREATRDPGDVIVLDLGLPDMSGVEVLESVRAWSNVPVIVLSIESAEEQKVMLLKLGADDYIVKPFGIAELAARCEAALRRYHKSADKNPIVRTGLLMIDLVSRSVTLGEERITLTRKEYRLLHILASHLGLVVTHQQLIKDIWGRSQGDNVQYLRMLVRKLRQKIELDSNQPKFLMTESGVGYRLERLKQEDLAAR
jgi:two-component system KDP operon response regulator KdpE